MFKQCHIAIFIIFLLLSFNAGAENRKQGTVNTNQEEKTYYLAKKWGTEGTGNGQFKGPSGIGASSTEIYVSDFGNSRIQVFDHDGNFLRIIGQSDSYHTERRSGQMSKPMNIEFKRNEVYVADAGLHRILIYSPTGQFHRDIGIQGTGKAEFNSPSGLAAIIDENETSTGHHHDLSQGGSFDITKMRGDEIIVTDTLNNRVHELRSFGRFLNFIGSEKSSNVSPKGDTFDGNFNQPTDAAVDQNDNIYISDGKNRRIIVFNPNGTYSHQWKVYSPVNSKSGKSWLDEIISYVGSIFSGIKKEEWFSPIMSIAIGPEGSVFVTDFFNGKILKYSNQGKLLNQFGISLNEDAQYTYSAVDVTPDGSVFVADYKNQKVEIWRPEGWIATEPRNAAKNRSHMSSTQMPNSGSENSQSEHHH